MQPVRTKGHTNSFGKPREWNEDRDGNCGTLSVRMEPHGLYNYHYSTWKPSAEELGRLVKGECVELCCVGIQPPVSVGVAPASTLEFLKDHHSNEQPSKTG